MRPAAVLARIDTTLERAGSDKTKIPSVTVCISDMDQKEAVNEARLEWMGSNNPPPRACVGVTLTPETLVEIRISAVP